MLTRFLTVFAGTCLLASNAYTASVNVSAADASGFSYKADPALANSLAGSAQFKTALSSGDDLMTGTRVYVGSFNITDSQIAANAQNPTYLFSNFSSFGFTTIGSGAGFTDEEGHFSATVQNNSSAFFGKQIYLFVLAATDYTSNATTTGSTFQLGIYYQDKSVNSAWAFPSSTIDFTNIELANLTVGGDGLALDSSGRVLAGSFGQDTSNLNGPAKNFTLASVPEPVTGVMFVGAAAILAARRRRRS